MIILSLWISVCSSLWEPGCVPQLGFNLPPEDKKLHLWDVTPTKWISLFSILSNNNSVARLPIGHTSHALSLSLSPTYLRTLTHTPTHAHTFLPLSRTHSLSLSLSLALLWWGQFLDSPLTHPSTPFWLICSYYCCFVKKKPRERENRVEDDQKRNWNFSSSYANQTLVIGGMWLFPFRQGLSVYQNHLWTIRNELIKIK